MSEGGLNRFAQKEVLQGIGRKLLSQFLAHFQSDLAASPISAFQHFSVSAFDSLPDDAFFAASVSLFASLLPAPGSPLHDAPPCLLEALTSIAEMSEPGQAEETCQQLSRLGVEIAFDPGTTPEHKAIILWFAGPLVLARLENYQNITLEPFRTEGQDTLKPNGIPSLSKVTLQKVKTDAKNAFHETSTRKADDLFSCPCPAGSPIPPGQIISACIGFYFNGSPVPHKVKLTTPGSIKLSHPQDAIPVARWLSKTHFLLSSVATKSPVSAAICHLLLALCNLLDLPLLPDLFLLTSES